MRDKKYYIALDDFELRVVVNCLNEMRNNLIANDKYTDAVDRYKLRLFRFFIPKNNTFIICEQHKKDCRRSPFQF